MRSLAGTEMPKEVLRTLWLRALPSQTQVALAVADQGDLNNLANLADRIAEVENPTVTAVSYRPPRNNLEEKVKDLVAEVNRLRLQLEAQRSGSQNRPRKHHSPDTKTPSTLCYFHEKFGDRARKCRQPCTWKTEN